MLRVGRYRCRIKDAIKRSPRGVSIGLCLSAGLFLLLMLFGQAERKRVSGLQPDGKKQISSARSTSGADGPSIVRSLTPERMRNEGLELGEYQKRWKEVSESGADDNDKLFKHRGFANAMALNGYSADAIRLIRDTYGPGGHRCELIQAVFFSDNNSDSEAAIYNTLEYEDEKTAACEGIGRQLAAFSSPAQVDLGRYSFLGPRVDAMLSTFSENSVARQFNKTSEEISAAFTQAFDLPLSKEAARITLLKLSELFPFDSWDELSSGDVELSSAARQQIIARMFYKDPHKAVEKISSAKNGEADFNPAFKQWLEIDSAKPIEWLQSHATTLTESQKAHAAIGIARFSASQGDLDVAKQWVAQITDSELRRKAEGQVWTMERDIVRRKVSSNPQAAIQAMISDETQHAPYWIETAMNQWVSKDRDAAWSWYQANARTLTPQQNEAVALSYARQALKNGQADVAAQWAAQVVTTKFKDKITAEIDSVAQKKN